VEGHEGYVPVDKGFFFPWLWRKLEMAGLHIVGRGPKRVHHHRPPELALPAPVEKACARIRKLVEVVGSLLCSRFSVDRIRVHDLWHFEHRLLPKILAYNLLVVLNITWWLSISPWDENPWISMVWCATNTSHTVR
jgi:hypothetical protein